jgi:hypothetical protein
MNNKSSNMADFDGILQFYYKYSDLNQNTEYQSEPDPNILIYFGQP